MHDEAGTRGPSGSAGTREASGTGKKKSKTNKRPSTPPRPAASKEQEKEEQQEEPEGEGEASRAASTTGSIRRYHEPRPRRAPRARIPSPKAEVKDKVRRAKTTPTSNGTKEADGGDPGEAMITVSGTGVVMTAANGTVIGDVDSLLYGTMRGRA